jgi:hypothetical protein
MDTVFAIPSVPDQELFHKNPDPDPARDPALELKVILKSTKTKTNVDCES